MIIDIIMASYNGEKYIAEQITSILRQTYKNIRLFIRDDGSTDNTVSIIKEFTRKDSRVFFIEDNLGSLRVGENFKNLLSYCSSDYVFLSDQDDFWNKDKVEILLKFSIENFQKSKPCIAYSSANVVNENLIDQNILTINKPKIVNSHDIFLMNGGIQGCSMVINKALYTLALKNKIEWYMHDQVLSLYAACFGKTFYLDQPLFKYRQHNKNVLGFNSSSTFKKLKKYILLRNNYLISKQSDELFINFFNIEKKELDEENELLFYNYIKRKNNKINFFYYIASNGITLKRSILKAIVKLIFSKEIIEK